MYAFEVGSGGIDMRTNFHDDRFKHFSIFMVITATISEAVIFVLLIEEILEVFRLYGYICHYMHTKFKQY
jgi:hypothetical protein